jgi:hypothetical protein
MKTYLSMTPREAATDLIRAYVERGDDPTWIRQGGMGSCSDRYHAQIGGYLFSGETGTRYGTDKILVTRMNGAVVNEVFSFEDIYNKIKSGITQPSLFS